MGFTKDPFSHLARANFLIIASDYEGYPNAAVEANYFGVPILLSKDTVGGATEIVISGFNGEIIDFANPDFSFLNRSYDQQKISEFIKQRHCSRLTYDTISKLVRVDR
jgi:glycosyltransferase involved in cell wall biosynthesis